MQHCESPPLTTARVAVIAHAQVSAPILACWGDLEGQHRLGWITAQLPQVAGNAADHRPLLQLSQLPLQGGQMEGAADQVVQLLAHPLGQAGFIAFNMQFHQTAHHHCELTRSRHGLGVDPRVDIAVLLELAVQQFGAAY